ncbi:MAG TPA: hypothetical protein VFD59_08520 [Nocardioidaceae bacterium]|nr:hypothetical protein [Nocardioidaceae bacterium]
MLVLGLILILFSVGVLVTALVGGANDTAELDIGFLSGETSTMVVFLFGAATVLIFVMGLEMTRSGVRRANRHRKDKKELNRLADQMETREADRRDTPSADPK